MNRCRRVDLMIRYLEEHRAEIEALTYGRVEFVAAGPAPLRASIQRSDQIVEDVRRLTA
jgi:hypothetical protein